MAQLEDLIKDIADPRLRHQIAGEVSKLKARKKFGLVFEQHIPELVQLPRLAVKPGARVVKRSDKPTVLFVVAAVNGKKASILPERGGLPESAAKDDLVVVKRFGEPIYPALVPVDKVTRAPGKPFHTLINADNFHALQVLLYCYEGQVDGAFDRSAPAPPAWASQCPRPARAASAIPDTSPPSRAAQCSARPRWPQAWWHRSPSFYL